MPRLTRPSVVGIITTFCLTLTACGPAMLRDNGAQDDYSNPIPGGHYVLVGMDGGAVPLRNTTLLVEEFRFSGNGPCNSYSADNNVELPGVSLSPIISTKTTCKDIELENRFFSVLQSATSVEFYGGVLKVKSPLTWLIFERGVRASSSVNALEEARGSQ